MVFGTMVMIYGLAQMVKNGAVCLLVMMFVDDLVLIPENAEDFTNKIMIECFYGLYDQMKRMGENEVVKRAFK